MAQLRLTTLGRTDLTGVAGGVILSVQSVHPTLLDCEIKARLRQ
jgi:hypothetical protein